MSLDIKCPMCGESATVPDDAMAKKAQCNVCHSRFFVKDAVVAREAIPVIPKMKPADGHTSRWRQFGEEVGWILGNKSIRRDTYWLRRVILAICGGVTLVIVLLTINKNSVTTSTSTSVRHRNSPTEIAAKEKAAAEEAQKIAEERQRAEMHRRMNEAMETVVARIQNDLIAPSSAKFSDVYVRHIERMDVYLVYGVVDSQNVYGAMLRNKFQRFLKYTNSGWTDITDKLSSEDVITLCNESHAQSEELLAQVQKVIDSLQKNK